MQRIINNELKELKIKISSESISLLIERAQGDRNNLRNEINKLKNYSLNKKTVSYDEINHEEFINGAQLNDYYTREIYPENISHFNEVMDKDINYPAEYCYGLVGN